MSIGERIAFYRARRGLTQTALANLVGRGPDWLGKIERGERPLRNIEVLTELARVLRVTLGDWWYSPFCRRTVTPRLTWWPSAMP